MPYEKGVRNMYSTIHGYVFHDRNFVYDKQTNKIMSRILEHDSNCLDIGANEGTFLKQILKFAPQGKHMAFEPIPELAVKIANQYPEVDVHECALYDAEGTSTFQMVTNDTGYSGIRRRSYYFENPMIREITVSTRLLDDIYPIDRPLHFVKIDIEGAEYQMILGGKSTLKKHAPYIVFEHGLGAANHYGTRPENLYDLLTEEIGLKISVMKDWLAGDDPLDKGEMVRQFDNSVNYYFLAHP
ncbi:MAG: FkbM family methyltransferase [Euryarchaeota archaeon]|nr:FkbM family methyltransferase [Euryarchaeota archaeon]